MKVAQLVVTPVVEVEVVRGGRPLRHPPAPADGFGSTGDMVNWRRHGDRSARTSSVIGSTLRVALCQCNLPVAIWRGTSTGSGELIARAAARGADLTVFPELSVTGSRLKTCS